MKIKMNPLFILALIVIGYILSYILLRVLGVYFVPKNFDPLFAKGPLYIAWEDQHGRLSSVIYYFYYPVNEMLR